MFNAFGLIVEIAFYRPARIPIAHASVILGAASRSIGAVAEKDASVHSRGFGD
jgi:hypothetical protein